MAYRKVTAIVLCPLALERADVHACHYQAACERMLQVMPTEIEDASRLKCNPEPTPCAHCLEAVVQVRKHHRNRCVLANEDKHW